jgi:excisionase family DNA binding protein
VRRHDVTENLFHNNEKRGRLPLDMPQAVCHGRTVQADALEGRATLNATEQDRATRVLLVPEAAAELRTSTWSLYRMIKEGQIKVLRVGRSIRVPATEIDRLLGGGK